MNNSKACPNTVFTSAITSVSHTCIFYHRVFCLHWMNSASSAMSPCRANIGSFWLIMTCSRLLEGEGSWQLDHRHKEQITWGESGDTFQPMGNGLSQARGKQEIKTRKQKSHTTSSTFKVHNRRTDERNLCQSMEHEAVPVYFHTM